MVFDDYSEIDSVTASYIYMAILTDTGSFKYASTTARTLDIAAALYRAGIDFENINIEIYQNITLGKFKFTNLILNSLELYRSNKIGFVFITNNILKNNGLIMEDTDGIIEMVRDISDVEIAIFAREVEDGVFKISLRSKRYYDVAELSLKFNGGGHKRAAGFTLYGTIDEIRDAILNEIEI
jgi:phosphoesterase RecJ-like protein